MNEISTPTAPNERKTPPAYTDRASLSEAWYRALYGAHGNAVSSQTSHVASVRPHEVRSCDDTPPEQTEGATSPGIRANSPDGAREHRMLGTTSAYRFRAKATTPQTIAQRTWRQAIAQRIKIRVQLAHGKTIEILVQQRGRSVHLSALGDHEMAQRAQAALARAHHALVLAGVRVTTTSRAAGVLTDSKGES